MRFSSYKPAEQLTGFVDNFWYYEGYEAEHANERILPTGTIELVINLREDELRIYRADKTEECSRYSGAVVSGPYKKGFLSDTDEEAFIMGVHFKPGGAFPFLGLPADELADTHVDLDTLWGSSALRLRERLCEKTSVSGRFAILQETLIGHLTRPMEHHYGVKAAFGAFALNVNRETRDIARDTGLSQRRFIQVFKAEVGMTPKLFSRVQRFQRARAIIEQKQDAPDWVDIAAECGYYDQSHMIREFLEFSGASPTSYLRQYDHLLERDIHVKVNHLPCV